MGYRIDKRKGNITEINILEKYKKRWKSTYPVLVFVAIFAILMGVFYSVWYSVWFNININPKILSVNATLSSKILNLLPLHTRVNSDIIFSSQFSISIKRGCDAMEAIGLFLCALLAFPARWKAKFIGLIAGVCILFFMNIVRITTLFLIGVYYPAAFDIMHVEVWQMIFIILSIVLWLLWLRYFTIPIKSDIDADYKTHS
jgi:exosortase/archaeosortase family protein